LALVDKPDAPGLVPPGAPLRKKVTSRRHALAPNPPRRPSWLPKPVLGPDPYTLAQPQRALGRKHDQPGKKTCQLPDRKAPVTGWYMLPDGKTIYAYQGQKIPPGARKGATDTTAPQRQQHAPHPTNPNTIVGYLITPRGPIPWKASDGPPPKDERFVKHLQPGGGVEHVLATAMHEIGSVIGSIDRRVTRFGRTGDRWISLQAAAAAGSASYSAYFAARVAYHASSRVPFGFAAKPLLAGIERAGLAGDVALDRVEHSLGDPRGPRDEGRQSAGTVPVTHWGPRGVRLPGVHPSGRTDLDPFLPDEAEDVYEAGRHPVREAKRLLRDATRLLP
jgi:hypothetical protein